MMEARNHDFCKNPSGLPKNQREIEIHSNYFPELHLKKSECYKNLTQQFPNSTSLSNDLSGAVLRALFRFSDRVNKKAEEMKGLAHMKDSKTAPHYVAIHLRTGTGLAGAVKEWKGPKRRELRRHGGNTFGKFLECACIVQREMADCLGTNGTSTPIRRELRRGRGDQHIGGWRNTAAASGLPEIYIASDDARAKQTIQSWDKTQTVKYLAEMKPLHIDYSILNYTNNPHADLPVLETFAELAILTNATCLVAGRSGYSRVAEQLSHQQPRCSVHFEKCELEQVRDIVRKSISCRSDYHAAIPPSNPSQK